MSEITVNRKTFHQYLILDEIKIPKEDVINEFGSVKEFQLQVPFREEKTENFIYTGGALMVGALMIFAIFNDVSRFL